MTFWVAGAVVGAGALAAGAGVYSANKASKAQQNAANQASQTELETYNQTRQDNMPALDARNASLQRLRDLLGISGNTGAPGYGSLGGPINPLGVESSPGYQFGLKQGLTTLNNQEVARGMSNSGQALKAAAQFGNDYATTKYDDAFNREVANRSAQLNPLQSVAGLGQTGASTVASAGMNYGNQVGQNIIGAGNAQAAASIAQGNAFANGVNQLSGWYQNYAKPNVGYTPGGSYQSNMADNIDAGGGWNPSDVRLKRDLRAVGTSPQGFTLYDWTWRDSGAPGHGVVAQEVAQRDPSAVRIGSHGFLEVNYSKV